MQKLGGRKMNLLLFSIYVAIVFFILPLGVPIYIFNKTKGGWFLIICPIVSFVLTVLSINIIGFSYNFLYKRLNSPENLKNFILKYGDESIAYGLCITLPVIILVICLIIFFKRR